MTALAPNAMVYAAGFGSRMLELTKDVPKPLLLVAGRTLLDRALDVVQAGAIKGAVVNLHYRGDQIRAHLASRQTPEISFSDESGAILETGGGLKRAAPLLGPGPVFAINADTFWNVPNAASMLRAAWTGAAQEALLLLAPVSGMKDPSRKGDFIMDQTGRLRWPRTGERAPWLYTGAQIIRPDRFASTEKQVFSTKEIWTEMITAGTCFGLPYAGGWVDVGRPEAIAEAEAMVRQ